MDIGDLLILLLFLLPVLSRLFGKKRPRPQQPPSAESPSIPRSGDDPLAEALRQIREALGEPEPEPAPPPPKPTRPHPVTAERSATSATSEFHGLGAFEHDEHGFGRSNPLSEEVFERQATARARGGTDRIKQKPLKQVDLTTPVEVETVPPSPRSSLADVLRDPARAREAFVMKEVLGPPRSLRPRH